MVPRWRIFGDILRPVLSASCVQHVSDLHPKFALKPHHLWKYANLRPLRLGEERKRWKKKPQDKNMMSASATQAGHNNMNIKHTQKPTLK